MHINVGLTNGSQKRDIKNTLELYHALKVYKKRILIYFFLIRQ